MITKVKRRKHVLNCNFLISSCVILSLFPSIALPCFNTLIKIFFCCCTQTHFPSFNTHRLFVRAKASLYLAWSNQFSTLPILFKSLIYMHQCFVSVQHNILKLHVYSAKMICHAHVKLSVHHSAIIICPKNKFGVSLSEIQSVLLYQFLIIILLYIDIFIF